MKHSTCSLTRRLTGLASSNERLQSWFDFCARFSFAHIILSRYTPISRSITKPPRQPHLIRSHHERDASPASAPLPNPPISLDDEGVPRDCFMLQATYLLFIPLMNPNSRVFQPLLRRWIHPSIIVRTPFPPIHRPNPRRTTNYCRSFVATTRSMAAVSGAEIRQHLFHGKTFQGNDVDGAMEALTRSDCVCFDVDSTVVNEEGIDVLADFLGKGQEVAAMTLQAMEGGMKFEDALAARLSLLQPSRQKIHACLQQHPLQLTDGVEKLIRALQVAKKDVYLVSGGFRIMIEPVAARLGIPKHRIVANTILFNDEGNYHSFDPNEPTSRDMGKPKALEKIRQAGGYTTMIMVGDGATDAQAKPPAQSFIGFGGVAVREKVVKVADWFVTDFEDLTQVVETYGKK